MGKTVAFFLLASLLALSGCRAKDSGAEQTKQDTDLSVLVYITGVTAGSPPYEMLAAGAEEFARANDNVRVMIYEAGFNQAEWEEQLTSLVAGGEFDLVLGSNPSLPEICASVGEKFPGQRFIVTDARYEGNPRIATYFYNQYEQSLYLGYLAGLITTGDMPQANAAKRIGFIAAQEYPLLSKHIMPGFLEGARRVDPDIELDFRVIGNWYDANKAAELASSMIDTGVDVFASIAGGAAQGMIRAARERGAYVLSYNTGEYDRMPGVIVGCGLMKQQKLVTEILGDVLAGNIPYGTSRTVGAKEGYLDFIADDPGYREHIPKTTRERFDAFMDDIRAGRVDFSVPPL
ncbi:MAG: BMP family ABC transporter substrate-binding protein [Treponema sp.]|jgi:simple sugar transport system substrate-binding protein|nr:BMP family ABC transporter substrate-binding protein [Treponema sp.]